MVFLHLPTPRGKEFPKPTKAFEAFIHETPIGNFLTMYDPVSDDWIRIKEED